MSNLCSFWLSIELKDDDKILENEKKFLELLQDNHLLSIQGEGNDEKRIFTIDAKGNSDGFFSFFEATVPEVFDGELLFFTGDCKYEITPKQFLGLKDAFCALAKANDMEIERISMQGENQVDCTIQRYEYPLPKFLRPDPEEIAEEIDKDDFDSEEEYENALEEKQNEYLRKYCLLTFSAEDIEEKSSEDDEWLGEHIEALEEALSQCAKKTCFDELYSPLPVHYYVYDELGEEDDYDIWEPEEEEEDLDFLDEEEDDEEEENPDSLDEDEDDEEEEDPDSLDEVDEEDEEEICGASLKKKESNPQTSEARAEEFISKLPSVELVKLDEDSGLYQLAGGKLECCCGNRTFTGTACLFSDVAPNGRQASTTTLLHDLTCSKCGCHLMFSSPICEDDPAKIVFVKDEQLEKLDEALETLNEDEQVYDISRGFVLDLDRKLLVSAFELSIFPFALLNETLNTSGLLFYTIMNIPDVLFNVNAGSFSSVDFGKAKVDSSAAYSASVLKYYDTMDAKAKQNVHLSLKPTAKPMSLEENKFTLAHLDWDYGYAIDDDGTMLKVTKDSHYDDWKQDCQHEIVALKKFFASHPELR